MAYVIGTEEERKKFLGSLEIGDWVSLLGVPYRWEAEDFENEYGEDLKPLPLLADTMWNNGFVFNDITSFSTMRRSYRNGILVEWDSKTRNIVYEQENFKGGIRVVDTVDRFQRFLRLIGLVKEANELKYNDHSKHTS
jgi:hypothetical protein